MSQPPDLRRELLLPEAQEALLVRADADDHDVVEPRVDVLANGVDVPFRVRAARDLLRHVLWPHPPRGGFEAGRARQLGHDLPAKRGEPEPLVGHAHRLLLIRGPAEGDLSEQPPFAAGFPPRLDQVVSRLSREEACRPVAREPRGLRTAGRDRERRWGLRNIPESGAVDRDMRAFVGDRAALEKGPDDVDRLRQHLMARLRRWPPGADDVLVEQLPGTEPERE